MKKKTTLYFALSALTLGLSVGFSSCDDDNNDEVRLKSNWENIYMFFPGNPRAGAVSFKLVVEGQERVYVGTGANTSRTEDHDRYGDFYYCYVADQNAAPEDYVKSTRWSSSTAVAPMPDEAGGRNGAVAFALNGKGYVGTGYNGVDSKKDFWCYDPDDSWTDAKGDVYGGSWSRVADILLDSLRNGVSFVLKDPKDGKEYAYVGTGIDNMGCTISSFCRFDGEKWSNVANCNVPREKATALVANGVASSPRAAGEPEVHEYAYLIGGNNNGAIELIERFNPYTQSWEKIDPAGESNMYSCMCASAGFVLGDSDNDSECKQRLYIVTGGVDYPRKTMWEYDPYNNSWKKVGDADQMESRRFATAWTLHYGPEKEERALLSLGSIGDITVSGVNGTFYSDTYMYIP